MIGTILAIDPGTTESAYVFYREGGILSFEKIPNRAMTAIADIAGRGGADRMAIEMPACYGMTVGKSVFETCRWVGIFQHAFGLSKTHIVYRKAQNKEEGIEGVCMHLCHNNRAKDPNVRQAIIDRYGGEEVALNGKKCPKCKGKGWFGAGRPVCPTCHGALWERKPGPLAGISTDCWAALAVAITFDESYSICREAQDVDTEQEKG